MAKTRKPWIRDQQMALTVGIVLTVAGALALRDAFEDRGQPRPWPLKLIGLIP
jgi:uncharacterized membrane protein HdeD (DUF308 family)